MDDEKRAELTKRAQQDAQRIDDFFNSRDDNLLSELKERSNGTAPALATAISLAEGCNPITLLPIVPILNKIMWAGVRFGFYLGQHWAKTGNLYEEVQK